MACAREIGFRRNDRIISSSLLTNSVDVQAYMNKHGYKQRDDRSSF